MLGLPPADTFRLRAHKFHIDFETPIQHFRVNFFNRQLVLIAGESECAGLSDRNPRNIIFVNIDPQLEAVHNIDLPQALATTLGFANFGVQ